jgi:hypothetical protein
MDGMKKLSAKEKRIRRETKKLITEIESHIGPIDIQAKRVAYQICKEANEPKTRPLER